MIKIKAKLKAIILFIIIIVFIASCGVDKEFQDEKISGYIIKKYRQWNHDLPVIVLDDGTEIDITSWSRGNNIFWKYAQVGDSIYKASGSLDLEVIKADKKSKKVFKYQEIPSHF